MDSLYEQIFQRFQISDSKSGLIPQSGSVKSVSGPRGEKMLHPHTFWPKLDYCFMAAIEIFSSCRFLLRSKTLVQSGSP